MRLTMSELKTLRPDLYAQLKAELTTDTPKTKLDGKKGTKQGRRADLDNRYFRSGYEANYCRYLNWLIAQGEVVKWEYEIDTFEFTTIKRGTRFYKPDFKVYWSNGRVTYSEVKGWLDPKSKTQLKRMKKFFPSVTIELIGQVELAEIRRKVGALIPTWE